jgi:hypothetical protein
MKTQRVLNIVLYPVLFLYCFTLQYNIPSVSFYAKENKDSEKHFIELSIQNVAIVDTKSNNRAFHPDNKLNKIENVPNSGLFTFKDNLFYLQNSITNNFFWDIVNNNIIFRDFKICFPFHFFF